VEASVTLHHRVTLHHIELGENMFLIEYVAQRVIYGRLRACIGAIWINLIPEVYAQITVNCFNTLLEAGDINLSFIVVFTTEHDPHMFRTIMVKVFIQLIRHQSEAIIDIAYIGNSFRELSLSVNEINR
jgi:hypothetical protein